MPTQTDVSLNLGSLTGLDKGHAEAVVRLVRGLNKVQTAEAQIFLIKQREKIINEKLIKDQATMTKKDIERFGLQKRAISSLLDLSKRTGMRNFQGTVSPFQLPYPQKTLKDALAQNTSPTVQRTRWDSVKDAAVAFKRGLIDSGFLKGVGKIGVAGVAFGAGIAVFETMTKNSKILSTVMETIGKLLGLFLDIIFLPLMPIFIYIIRGCLLYTSPSPRDS